MIPVDCSPLDFMWPKKTVQVQPAAVTTQTNVFTRPPPPKKTATKSYEDDRGSKDYTLGVAPFTGCNRASQLKPSFLPLASWAGGGQPNYTFWGMRSNYLLQ